MPKRVKAVTIDFENFDRRKKSDERKSDQYVNAFQPRDLLNLRYFHFGILP